MGGWGGGLRMGEGWGIGMGEGRCTEQGERRAGDDASPRATILETKDPDGLCIVPKATDLPQTLP